MPYANCFYKKIKKTETAHCSLSNNFLQGRRGKFNPQPSWWQTRSHYGKRGWNVAHKRRSGHHRLLRLAFNRHGRDGGADFAQFLSALEKCGYGWAYRMLDAQYIGVPQSCRRVFVVGHIDDLTKLSAKVLFERQWYSSNLKKDKKLPELLVRHCTNSYAQIVGEIGKFNETLIKKGISQVYLVWMRTLTEFSR